MGTEECHLVASAVASELRRTEQSVEWLSERSGIDQIALKAKLRTQSNFTMVDLANIAAALNIPVAALTPSERPQSN